MKRIKVYLISFLIFICVSSVRAETNTVDYTVQLTQIKSEITELRNLFFEVGSIIDDIYSQITLRVPDHNYWTSFGNTVVAIRDRINEFKPLLQNSLSDLDSILSYVTDFKTTLQDLKSISDATQASVMGIDLTLMNIAPYFSELSHMSDYLNQIEGQIQSVINKGELNREETQQAIMRILEGVSDQADSIKEALDIIQEDGGLEEVTDAIGALKNEVTQIARTLQVWDTYFFRYLYDRTFPNPAFEFYHISGSPFFESGYLTYSQQIGPLSSFSFVDWLASALTAHIEGLNVINDNLLFIAKVLSTNGQEQAMAEFQEEANDTVNTIQSQYTELINSSSYTPKEFDLSKTHLNDVRSFFGGLSGQNSYDSVKVHNLDFTSLEIFGLPTHIDYRYDISESSTFWEVCRAFFTCLWVFLFASVFFMVVRTFYHFYHICFNALAGNRSQGYEVSSIPLNW